jgi:hypothetical protein
MRRGVVRSILWSALPAVVWCSAAAQGVSDPYTALEGKWTWVGNVTDPGTAKACTEKWTELKFSSDRKVLTYRYLAANGETKSGTYNVLYQDNNSIAMYLNGEERRLKGSNDRYIWIAIIESPSRFLWRIHGQATDAAELAKYARIRCPG